MDNLLKNIFKNQDNLVPQMYAIINKRTKKFLYGTDYRYIPCRQRTSKYEAKLYENYAIAMCDLIHRRCNKDYKIVKVELRLLDDKLED